MNKDFLKQLLPDYVICVDDAGLKNITSGVEYEVNKDLTLDRVKNNPGKIFIINDRLVSERYDAKRFTRPLNTNRDNEFLHKTKEEINHLLSVE